jgi:hypothetical protein
MVYGRTVLWFLDKSLTKKVYQKFYKDTQTLSYSFVYRGLIGVIIDIEAWKKIDPWIDLEGLSLLDKDQNYLDLSGQGKAMYVDKDVSYLQFVTYDKKQSIDIPMTVIRSSYTTGFPKVAYTPDRYVSGLFTLVRAFEEAFKHGDTIHYDWRFFQPSNFDETIFPLLNAWQDIYQRHLGSFTLETKVWLKQGLDLFIILAKHAMTQRIITYRKSPYHGMTEYQFDKTLLCNRHLIIEAYKEVRQAFKLGNDQ